MRARPRWVDEGPSLCKRTLPLSRMKRSVAWLALAQDLVAGVEIDHLSDREDAQDFLVGEVAEERHLAQDFDLAIELLRARLAASVVSGCTRRMTAVMLSCRRPCWLVNQLLWNGVTKSCRGSW